MRLSPFRKKSFVGLDLGSHAIKAVQLERTATGWRVTRHSTTPTPEGAIKDGVVIDGDAVTESIRRLLKSGHIHATCANIGVAGATVVVRNVRIPKMPEATLRKSIRFEAGRYVPTSVEDSFIEFEILGYPDDGQMDVLIVAAPKDVVESRVKACQAAGLEVEVVDLEPFAGYRALVETDAEHDWAEKTVAIVDIGAHTTSVSVVSKGVFSMTRAIPQGGSTLTGALKQYFKLTDADAESGKTQLDFRELLSDAPQENPPLRVLQPHVDELIREIRRSLNYYQSQQTDAGQPNPVTQVLLSGGSAKMNGLAGYMSQKLALEVTPLGVFDNPRFLVTEDEGHGLEMSVASGLAMRAFARAA